MRVARALSVLGFCSRREADRLVAASRVTINEGVVASPGELVDLSTDRVFVDGKLIEPRSTLTYVALHKPAGVVSTVRDPHAASTVVDLVPSRARLYPVGRLDKDSEGLILLTNDGDFAQTVAHPRNRTEKEYLVQLRGPVGDDQLRRLREGIVLDGRPIIPVAMGVYRGPIPWGSAHARGGGTWLRIVLVEGRNREVRRMLEAVGHRAARLIRTRIGALRLGRLQPRQWRHLSAHEVAELMRSGRAGRQVPFVVAIDGPSGSGKTAVGTAVAQALGATFLDTGALYRAVALVGLEQGIALDDGRALARVAHDLDLQMETNGAETTMWLDGRDVTAELRSSEVDASVSEVASHEAVRTALIPAQRRAAGRRSAVVAGRDIGTVIFPSAAVKVYLDASPTQRARRRAAQLGQDSQLPDVVAAMAKRDETDTSRAAAPLRAAADAVVVDTDQMDVEAVVSRVLALARRRMGRRG